DGAEAGLRLVFSLKPYWINRGLLGLGQRITADALGRAGAQDRTAARSRGLTDAGQLAFYMGHYSEAAEYLDESLAIAGSLLPPSMRWRSFLEPKVPWRLRSLSMRMWWRLRVSLAIARVSPSACS